MKRGICPAGHLEAVGEVGDRCEHICNNCGTACNKRLKSWSGGYTSEPCSCIVVAKNDDRQMVEFGCPSGHAEQHMRTHSNQCYYTCNRCGRVCGRTLQPTSEMYSEIWCECYENDGYYYAQEQQEAPDKRGTARINIDYIFDDTQGDPLDDEFCKNLFDNIPFNEPPPLITYVSDINRDYWRLF